MFPVCPYSAARSRFAYFLKVLANPPYPGPLEDIFDSQAVPILKEVPNIHTAALWREIKRLNPELSFSVERTFERRVRQWRAEPGIFPGPDARGFHRCSQ